MSEFSNQQLTAEQITPIQQLNFVSLAPQYPKAHRLVCLITTLAILLLLVSLLYQPWISLPLPLELLISGACAFTAFVGLSVYLYRYFADPLKGYALREQDISYSSGLFFRSIVSQPILRVQHVELKRGPVDRKIGLTNLQVFSAGGSHHTFEIPGLEQHHGEQLRQYILSHKDLELHG